MGRRKMKLNPNKYLKDKKVLVPGFSPGSGRIENKIEETYLG